MLLLIITTIIIITSLLVTCIVGYNDPNEQGQSSHIHHGNGGYGYGFEHWLSIGGGHSWCDQAPRRLDLARHNISVSLINPGFVDTPMTAVNDFPMPYLVKPGDAADRILRGLKRGKFEIAFPWQLVGGLKALRILPYSLYFRLVQRLTSKR